MIQNFTQKPTCLVRLRQSAEITRDTVAKLYTLYVDTVVDLTIGKVVGNYAALGLIEIYQYETDPNRGGGPQNVKTEQIQND